MKKTIVKLMSVALSLVMLAGFYSCKKEYYYNVTDNAAGRFQLLKYPTGENLLGGNAPSLFDGDTLRVVFEPKEKYKDRAFDIQCDKLVKADNAQDLYIAKGSSLSLGENTISLTATCKVSFDDGDDHYTYDISATQSCKLTLSAPTVLEVSTESIELSATGGEQKTVKVTCNTSWQATSNASWLKVIGSGNGNGSLVVYADNNDSTSPRTGIVTVATTAGEKIQKEISVTQAGIEVSPVLFEAPYTVWGSARSTVKGTMSTRGYTLASESTSASDNYYLTYNGKYKELGSMYMFDNNMKLNQVIVMFQSSVATTSQAGQYLTSELGYIYVTSINGTDGYVSKDEKTVVLVSSQSVSGQDLTVVTFADPNQVSDQTLFEAPYTVWGAARSTVKSTMSSRGYTLADESTSASDNYYLGYEGKYQELASMYMFDTNIKLSQVAVLLEQSVASVDEVGDYLTSELGYTYLSASGGSKGYVSSDYETLVAVSTQTVSNQVITVVTFIDVNSLSSATPAANKQHAKTYLQKMNQPKLPEQLTTTIRNAKFQKTLRSINQKQLVLPLAK